MTKRYFTEKEIEELVDGDTGKVLREEGLDDRSWVKNMLSVVVADDDNKTYRIYWDKGLTESQENMYPEGECPEVFAHHEVEVRATVDYLTADEIGRIEAWRGVNEDIDSLRLVSGDSDKVDECFTPEKVKQMREALVMLDSLEAVDPVADFAQYRVTSQRYLKALLKYAEER